VIPRGRDSNETGDGMGWTTRLVGVLVSAGVIAAALAGVAGASPKTLHLYYIEEGVEREFRPEQQFELYDTHWRIEAAEGYVECTSSERNTGFFGENETNNQKTDGFFVFQTFDSLFANPSCTSSFAFTGTEAEGFWYNANNPPEERQYVTAQLRLTAKETAEYVSGGKEDNTIEFRASGAAGARCYYEVSKLKGSLDALPGSLRASFNQQKLKLLKMNNSDARCPKKATLSTSFKAYTYEVDGTEVSAYGRVS
jgi:hypothetical protein